MLHCSLRHPNWKYPIAKISFESAGSDAHKKDQALLVQLHRTFK